MRQDKANKKNLGRAYKRTLSEVRGIVNSRDPEGLLAMHAPEDEYDGEAAAILRGLRTCRDAEHSREQLPEPPYSPWVRSTAWRTRAPRT
jgi:hypothetical protein